MHTTSNLKANTFNVLYAASNLTAMQTKNNQQKQFYDIFLQMTMQFIQLVTYINFEAKTCWQISCTLITDVHRNLQWREENKIRIFLFLNNHYSDKLI